MTAARTKRTSNTDHIVMRAPNTLLCLHCGQHYDYAVPAPIDIVVAIGKAFEGLHKWCKRLPETGLVCHFCFKFGHEPTSCNTLTYVGDPQRWLNGPDTGLSSITIWHVMMGRQPPRSSHPYDPSDFGRCHRLLAAFPSWRARIGEMAAVAGWGKLAPAWDELEAFWNEEVEGKTSGSAPKLYARIQELTR